MAEDAEGSAETAWLAERIGGWSCGWRDYLAREGVCNVGAMLRRHERTGRPLGGEEFVRTVGDVVGRNLLRQKPGPKPKTQRKKPRS